MEPFIGEIFFFAGDEVREESTVSDVDAPDETPAVKGGLDRDIIRRVAKDHADEVEAEPVDQIEFNEAEAEPMSGHSKGVYPLIYIPGDDDGDPEPQADFVINDDLIVDGSLATEDTTEAFLFG